MHAADRAAAQASITQQPLAGLVVGLGGPNSARPVANATHVGGVIALVFQRNVLRQYHSARVAFVGELCESRRGAQPESSTSASFYAGAAAASSSSTSSSPFTIDAALYARHTGAADACY